MTPTPNIPKCYGDSMQYSPTQGICKGCSHLFHCKATIRKRKIASISEDDLREYINGITSWAKCNALITRLEAQRAKLNPPCVASKP
jgi:hypothetical protein